MTNENKILVKYLLIALLLIGTAYLSGIEIINGLVSIFDLYLISALLLTGFRKDHENKKYYYFLSIYLVVLVLFTVVGLLNGLVGIILLIAPHLWFVRNHKLTISPQLARSWYFIISPIITLALFYLLSSMEIFSMYGLSPISFIARLI